MRTILLRRVRLIITLFGAHAICAGPLPAGQPTPSDAIPTVSLTLSPSAEPVPALKYHLVPPLGERTKGNAALGYYRAVVQYQPTARGTWFAKFVNEKLDAWLAMPLDNLPQNEVANALRNFESVLKELDRAALRDHCSWELPVESDGMETLLAEFQDLRQPARLVALRARLQMARGDLDGSLQSLRSNCQLSRNLGQGPFIITSLIGISVAQTNREQLETFVQQPAAPNLYWALTELPVPLVGFRLAIESEARLPEYSFPEIVQFQSRPLSRDEARRLSDRLLKRWLGINDAGNTIEEARARFALSAVAGYSADKQTLIAAGRPKDEVEKMPVEQVVWLASYYRWQVWSQDLVKWSFLPLPQQRAGIDRTERRLSRFADERRDAPFEFINLLPAIGAGIDSLGRLDRGIALLRIVEALRLYAHLHSGALPTSLDKIDVVPVPADPITGNPFNYRLNGDTAVLETAPAFNSKWMGRRYLIRVRK
jgi:hypothetical protein